MNTSRTVGLELSDDASNLFRVKTSADHYGSLINNEFFMVLDLADTYTGRYTRLLEYDIPSARWFDPSPDGNPNVPGDDPNASHSQGSFIDYTASHHWAAGLVTAVFGIMAIANLYRAYRKQKQERANSTHTFLVKEFNRKSNEEEKASTDVAEQKFDDINYYLNKIIQERLEKDKAQVAKNGTQHDLLGRYKSVRVNRDTNKLEFEFAFTPKKPAPKSLWQKAVDKVLNPAWQFLCTSSFAYWIFWIGCAYFTGHLGLGIDFNTGVSAADQALGFGIPFAAGAAYPIYKSYNYFQNRRKKKKGETTEEAEKADEEFELQKIAARDSIVLMRTAILRKNFDNKMYALKEDLEKHDIILEPEIILEIDKDEVSANEHLSIDNEIDFLGKHRKTKIAATVLTGFITYFVCSQYVAWISLDFLKLAMNVSMSLPVFNAIGGLMFAAAGIYAIYKAVERHKSVRKDKDAIAAQQEGMYTEVKNAEQRYAEIQARIHDLQKQLSPIVDAYNHLVPAEEKFDKNNFIKLPTAPVKYNEPQFYTDVQRNGPISKWNWTLTKKVALRALTFFNGFCTGAMFARFFFVAGNALILPFAAAALANPYTIGIVVAVAIGYGVFKAVEYHYSRKEARAKQLFEQRGERVTCLNQQFKLAKLTEQSLLAKKEKLNVKIKELVAANDRVLNTSTDDLANTKSLLKDSTLGVGLFGVPYANGNGQKSSKSYIPAETDQLSESQVIPLPISNHSGVEENENERSLFSLTV